MARLSRVNVSSQQRALGNSGSCGGRRDGTNAAGRDIAPGVGAEVGVEINLVSEVSQYERRSDTATANCGLDWTLVQLYVGPPAIAGDFGPVDGIGCAGHVANQHVDADVAGDADRTPVTHPYPQSTTVYPSYGSRKTTADHLHSNIRAQCIRVVISDKPQQCSWCRTMKRARAIPKGSKPSALPSRLPAMTCGKQTGCAGPRAAPVAVHGIRAGLSSLQSGLHGEVLRKVAAVR